MAILYKKAQQGLKSKLIQEVRKGNKNTKNVERVGRALTGKTWERRRTTIKNDITSITKQIDKFKQRDYQDPTFAAQTAYKRLNKRLQAKKKRLKEINHK